VTEKLTSPGPFHRARVALVATLFLAALAASACGTQDDSQEGLAPLHQGTGPTGGGHQLPVSVDPMIANLDPDLLDAFRAAAHDALADGVRLSITSGWRSRAHQQRLFDEAVRKYGSEQEALRWVSTPDTSAHVTGDAIDVGPTDADDWLVRHGSRYGLCQVFANEMWHFELATTPGGSCPDLLPDSSYRSR
jgi:hypothetical protein